MEDNYNKKMLRKNTTKWLILYIQFFSDRIIKYILKKYITYKNK